MPSCFISYARDDDEPFAERLRVHLEGAGVAVWWAREAMLSRGVTFLQEIEDAIRSVDRIVLICGPAAKVSAYVAHELGVAARHCRVVVPVLRLGRRIDVIPSELKGHHHFNLYRTEDGSEAAARELERLARTLAGPPDPLAPVHPGAPPVPEPLLDRGEATEVEDRVLVLVREAGGAGHGKPLTVLSGMSGIGKTVLAARLSRSCRLRRSFADGVLFTRAGPSATGLDLVNDLRRRLGDVPGAGEGLDEAVRVLAGMVRQGRRLVIVDDVWHDKQLLPVIGALEGTASQIVATSRQADLGAGVEGVGSYDVTLPTAEQAWRLLLDAAKVGHEDAPGEAETIVGRCGQLPLALAICGAYLRRGGSWTQLLAGLEAYDPDVLELPLATYEHPGVFAAMQVALAELQQYHPRLAERYQVLGLFSPGDPTPLPVIFRAWACGSAADRRGAGLGW